MIFPKSMSARPSVQSGIFRFMKWSYARRRNWSIQSGSSLNPLISSTVSRVSPRFVSLR